MTFANPPVPSAAGVPETSTINNLTDGLTYYFAVKAVDTAGNTSPLSNVAQVSLPLGFSESEIVLPSQSKLVGNFPNPFNSSTRIDYNIGYKSHVLVMVHDLLGRTVSTLVDNLGIGGEL